MSIASTPIDGHEVVNDDLAQIVERAATELDSMAGDRLLVVGGGGFVGYYLIQAALRWNESERGRPISVTVFDNWARGLPKWVSALGDATSVDLATVDITQPVPDEYGPFDWIVHAASIASPTFYRRYPIETMDANVNGVRNLLDFALAQKRDGSPVKGFLFFSTSEIYGDPPPEAIPTTETYRGNVSCTGPRACYDESKRFGETLCVTFAQVHDLPVKIVRPFNNYGPGLKINDGRVIPDFAGDVLAGRDIRMFSSGSPTRTFCYIADAVVGYYKVLVHGKSGEPYNIGTEGPEISVLDLAESIAAIARDHLGYRGTVIRSESDDADYLTDNPNRRRPNIEKTRTNLGFSPVVELNDGLMRSLLWYRDVADTAVAG